MRVLSIPANLQANIFSLQNNAPHEADCGLARRWNAVGDWPVPTDALAAHRPYSNLADVTGTSISDFAGAEKEKERERESMGANECGQLGT